jgi:MoaA/NifB/PqqE/SkfB family radical SAM enzyme
MIRDEYSPFKIVHHALAIERFKAGEIVAPITVTISPTNRCNHNCKFCFNRMPGFYGNELFKASDEIPTERLQEIVMDLSYMGVKSIHFTGGGEPFLHTGLPHAIELALSRGLEVGMITNGSLITPAIADLICRMNWVRVSLDADNPLVYSHIRGVAEPAFFDVIDNLAMLVAKKRQAGSTCNIGVSYMIEETNYKGVVKAVEFYKTLGVDNVRLACAITSKGEGYFTGWHAEAEAEAARAESLSGGSFSVFNLFNQRSKDDYAANDFGICYHKDFVGYIGADLNVYTCCRTSYSHYGLVGSIAGRKFSEFWVDPLTRAALENHNPMLDCPFPCMFHKQNEFLNYAFKSNPRDVNFI